MVGPKVALAMPCAWSLHMLLAHEQEDAAADAHPATNANNSLSAMHVSTQTTVTESSCSRAWNCSNLHSNNGKYSLRSNRTPFNQCVTCGLRNCICFNALYKKPGPRGMAREDDVQEEDPLMASNKC